MGNGLRGLAILGSTGSIGRQTLDVVRSFPDRFSVVGLAAGKNCAMLAQQVQEFSPQVAYSAAPTPELESARTDGCRWASLEEIATHPDVDAVMVATVGRVGLAPTLAAIRQGKTIILANKEVIVAAGELVMAEARRYNVPVLPVDSEPSAIWQCLRGEDSVARLILTASGGPFRERPIEELAHVTPEEALKHPTWSMGDKVTIDSSTLMNKGMEVIESHCLFDIPYEKIDVVVHPQSIVHSFVEFADGSIKAQIGPPDMRLPIQYALTYPERWYNKQNPRLASLADVSFTFQELDQARYPCFRLAVEAGRKGGTYPAVLSAADEVAVNLFLNGRIGFTEIFNVVEGVLAKHTPASDPSLEDILLADQWAREAAAS
ncbi:MAG: 1-deoxy-D-xylulose-5-phosphate reductoisomerase [Dehalococcoidia bacterium]